MKLVTFALEADARYFAQIDGDRFLVGKRIGFDGGKGLINLAGAPGQRYDRAAHRATHGFWADFIHPTASVEGGLFHALNTYDRARFTFGFLQFAAHVPNGDFVRYLRALLALPLATEYFPDLRLENDRIVRLADGGSLALESDDSTARLLDYLNPSREQVEDTEVIQAAKFVHWAQHDPEHRRVQVDVGVRMFRAKMREYAQRYDLDGANDDICLVVSDIRHQGRAKSVEIIAALQQTDPLAALMKIGQHRFPDRIAMLAREIQRLLADGTLGTRRYDVASRDFVVR